MHDTTYVNIARRYYQKYTTKSSRHDVEVNALSFTEIVKIPAAQLSQVPSLPFGDLMISVCA
jgi:hypothetical protein